MTLIRIIPYAYHHPRTSDSASRVRQLLITALAELLPKIPKLHGLDPTATATANTLIDNAIRGDSVITQFRLPYNVVAWTAKGGQYQVHAIDAASSDPSIFVVADSIPIVPYVYREEGGGRREKSRAGYSLRK